MNLHERFEKEREERIKASPTLLEVLIKKLEKHNLKFEDIEAVVIDDQGKPKLLGKEEAKLVLSKGKLLNEHAADHPHNIPCFAYTRDRIFFIQFNDELAIYRIGSIPRNPTTTELPYHLPSQDLQD